MSCYNGLYPLWLLLLFSLQLYIPILVNADYCENLFLHFGMR